MSKRPSIADGVKQLTEPPVAAALDILNPGASAPVGGPATPAVTPPPAASPQEPPEPPQKRSSKPQERPQKREVGIASYRLYKDQIAKLRSLATERANQRGEGKADASEVIREILDAYFAGRRSAREP